MPIYRFETSNAYTNINADTYQIDRHGRATFTLNGTVIAVLRDWQSIVNEDALHTKPAPTPPPRPTSGLPL